MLHEIREQPEEPSIQVKPVLRVCSGRSASSLRDEASMRQRCSIEPSSMCFQRHTWMAALWLAGARNLCTVKDRAFLKEGQLRERHDLTSASAVAALTPAEGLVSSSLFPCLQTSAVCTPTMCMPPSVRASVTMEIDRDPGILVPVSRRGLLFKSALAAATLAVTAAPPVARGAGQTQSGRIE